MAPSISKPRMVRSKTQSEMIIILNEMAFIQSPLYSEMSMSSAQTCASVLEVGPELFERKCYVLSGVLVIDQLLRSTNFTFVGHKHKERNRQPPRCRSFIHDAVFCAAVSAITPHLPFTNTIHSLLTIFSSSTT